MKVSLRITDPLPQLWQHRHDIELGGVRPVVDPENPDALKGAPEVFVLLDYSVPVTKQWQFYCRAINPAMAVQHIAALFGDEKAFCNGQGFGNPNNLRANYLLEEDLTFPLPKFGKVYTCGGSVLAGNVSGSYLIVETLDGNREPPLRPGHKYPQSVDEINPDDYLFLPETHPWLFLVAVNVKSNGTAFPFANGGVYSWTPDPTRPFSFLPHVSRYEVRYPLSKLKKVPLGAPVPSPYYP